MSVFPSLAWWSWGNGQRLIFLLITTAEDVIKQTYTCYSKEVDGIFVPLHLSLQHLKKKKEYSVRKAKWKSP